MSCAVLISVCGSLLSPLLRTPTSAEATFSPLSFFGNKDLSLVAHVNGGMREGDPQMPPSALDQALHVLSLLLVLP